MKKHWEQLPLGVKYFLIVGGFLLYIPLLPIMLLIGVFILTLQYIYHGAKGDLAEFEKNIEG